MCGSKGMWGFFVTLHHTDDGEDDNDHDNQGQQNYASFPTAAATTYLAIAVIAAAGTVPIARD